MGGYNVLVFLKDVVSSFYKHHDLLKRYQTPQYSSSNHISNHSFLTNDIMRGHDQQVKVHYKGSNNDFIVFVESAKAVQDWKADKSVPLVQVVDSFKVFVSNG